MPARDEMFERVVALRRAMEAANLAADFPHQVVIPYADKDFWRDDDGPWTPYSGDGYAVTPTMEEWLDQNVGPDRCQIDGETFGFKDKNDAMSFKLRFDPPK